MRNAMGRTSRGCLHVLATSDTSPRAGNTPINPAGDTRLPPYRAYHNSACALPRAYPVSNRVYVIGNFLKRQRQVTQPPGLYLAIRYRRRKPVALCASTKMSRGHRGHRLVSIVFCENSEGCEFIWVSSNQLVGWARRPAPGAAFGR
jgi:hypothetical protein